MISPRSEETLLKAIQEAEEEVRRQIDLAERQREQIIEGVRERAKKLQIEREALLRLKINQLREKRQQDIQAELQRHLREADAQAKKMEEQARTRVERAGQFVLSRLMPH